MNIYLYEFNSSIYGINAISIPNTSQLNMQSNLVILMVLLYNLI